MMRIVISIYVLYGFSELKNIKYNSIYVNIYIYI